MIRRAAMSLACLAPLACGGMAAAQAQEEGVAEEVICANEVRTSQAFIQARFLPSDFPVGTIVPTLLDKDQFGCIVTGTWVVADGGRIPETYKLAVLVRLNPAAYAPMVRGDDVVVPDMRGVFLRSKNYRRSPAEGNTAGDLPLGHYQKDDVGPHTHPYVRGQANAGRDDRGDGWFGTANGVSGNPSSPDEERKRLETRPRSVTVNHFVRVN